MANATETTSRLFAAVRETQDQNLRLAIPNEHARARARLLQAVDRIESKPASVATDLAAASTGGRSTGWRWGVGASLAAAACAFAVLFALPDQPKNVEEIATLEFSIDGVEVGANKPIEAGAQPQLLAVSDSTRIELATHSSMFVDEIRSNGATVVLDHGQISLAVHHEDDTSWQVEAGPWTVHVTGTQFVVAWEPSAEHFRVAVSEGSVRVEGPDGEIAKLRAGDELIRATIEAETLTKLTNSGVATVEPGNAPQPSIETIPPELDSKPSPVKPTPAARGWAHYFNDADYQGAWDALSGQAGIHSEAERVNAKTMLDLADVARFTKHGSDTRKLLERLRVRFPNSTEASEAAFTLGRLAADGGSQAKAAVWFERYLDERPNGSFAGDALGRLMDCYDALGQGDGAKSTAERYLAGHPNGPHAAKAEKILAR